MPILSLIFNRPKRAQIGAMQLDASLVENHIRVAKPTKESIEDGTTVSDHVKLEPAKLTIKGQVSDVPLGIFQSAIGTALGATTSAVAQSFGGESSLSGTIAGEVASAGIGSLAKLLKPKPSERGGRTINTRDPNDAFRYLEELWAAREPFTVITALRVYNNMIVSNLDVPRSASIGKSLTFTLQVEEITIVKSSIIQVPPFQVVPQGATSKAKLGRSEAKQAGEGATNNGSILFKGYNFLGGS